MSEPQDKPNDAKEKHIPPSERWRTQRPTQRRLQRLFQQNNLSDDAWQRGQELAGYVPTRANWLGFIDLLMLSLGTAFVIAGIFFFFAFNWADLPKFGRFAVLEVAVVVATIAAFIAKLDTWVGRMCLAAAALLIGATLAVVGQTYQTGADSYRLFLVWTMLITGWVLISRWNIMYLIWMVLVNVSLSTYWWQVVNADGLLFNVLVLSINFGFVLVWDVLAHRNVFAFMKKGRWFLYLTMIPALLHATYLMLNFIFNFNNTYVTVSGFAPIIYIGLMVLLYGVYFYRKDLLMLTMAALSVLVVLVSGIGRVLFEVSIADDLIFFTLLLMGGITIGLTAGMVTILRRLQVAWGLDDE